MNMKKLLLAGGAAALMSASTAYSSIIDRPFFQVLGVVVVWGDDNGGGIAAPVVSDFVLLTPASGLAGADLIAGDVSTVVTGTLTEVVGGAVATGGTAVNPVTGAASGGVFADDGNGVLDAADTLSAFGIDPTTDIEGGLSNTHNSSFYVASNAAFDIFAVASGFTATGDFGALDESNITYAMSIDVAGDDGLAYGGNAQDPSTGGTGVDASISNLSLMTASTKVFDGGRRTASAVGGLASQSVRFDNTYTLDAGGGAGYDLSQGVGTVTADVTFTIFVP